MISSSGRVDYINNLIYSSILIDLLPVILLLLYLIEVLLVEILPHSGFLFLPVLVDDNGLIDLEGLVGFGPLQLDLLDVLLYIEEGVPHPRSRAM